MRNWYFGIVGAVLVSLTSGCGGEPESPGFKPTDTSQFDQMKNQMMEKFKKKSFQKVDATPAAKPEQKNESAK